MLEIDPEGVVARILRKQYSVRVVGDLDVEHLAQLVLLDARLEVVCQGCRRRRWGDRSRRCRATAAHPPARVLWTLSHPFFLVPVPPSSIFSLCLRFHPEEFAELHRQRARCSCGDAAKSATPALHRIISLLGLSRSSTNIVSYGHTLHNPHKLIESWQCLEAINRKSHNGWQGRPATAAVRKPFLTKTTHAIPSRREYAVEAVTMLTPSSEGTPTHGRAQGTI